MFLRERRGSLESWHLMAWPAVKQMLQALPALRRAQMRPFRSKGGTCLVLWSNVGPCVPVCVFLTCLSKKRASVSCLLKLCKCRSFFLYVQEALKDFDASDCQLLTRSVCFCKLQLCTKEKTVQMSLFLEEEKTQKKPGCLDVCLDDFTFVRQYSPTYLYQVLFIL